MCNVVPVLRDGVIAPRILNRGTAGSGEFTFKALSFYSWRKPIPLPRYPLNMECGKLEKRYEALGKNKKSLFLPGIELQFLSHPGRGPLIIPTEPFRPLFHSWQNSTCATEHNAQEDGQRSTERSSKQ